MDTHAVCKVLVMTPEGKLLLIRRSKTAPRRPLEWDLPGGWMDANEDVLDVIVREAKEEAGIMLEKATSKLVYAITQVRSDINLVFLYVASHSSEQRATLSYEHDDYCWVTLEEAIERIEYPLQKGVLQHLADNKVAL